MPAFRQRRAAPEPEPDPLSLSVTTLTAVADGTDLSAGEVVTLTTSAEVSLVPGAGGTLPWLTLSYGAALAYDARGSTTTALRFTYVVQTGQDTADFRVTGLDLDGADNAPIAVAVADATGDGNLDIGAADFAGSTELACDSAGNEGPASAALVVVEDRTAPAVAVASPGGLTHQAARAVVGAAEAGSSVALRDGQTVLGTATAGPDGAWAVDVVQSGQSPHLLTAPLTVAPGVRSKRGALQSRGGTPGGAQRQHCGQFGKKANCQALVSLTLACGDVPVLLALRLLLATSALLPLAIVPADAQNFPERPPRILGGFTAGGTSDLVNRILAESAAATLGTRPVVEIRTGANGFLAAAEAVCSPADGYTVVQCSIALLTITPELPGANMPVDPGRDLLPVANFAHSMQAMVVGAGSPYRTVAEFLAAAHAAGHVDLRQFRRRRGAPPVRGAVRATRGRAAGPRALPRRGAPRAGGDGRTCGHHHHQPRRRGGADPRGRDAPAGLHGRHRQPGFPRRAANRARRAGLRRQRLVRLLRPARHARARLGSVGRGHPLRLAGRGVAAPLRRKRIGAALRAPWPTSPALSRATAPSGAR